MKCHWRYKKILTKVLGSQSVECSIPLCMICKFLKARNTCQNAITIIIVLIHCEHVLLADNAWCLNKKIPFKSNCSLKCRGCIRWISWGFVRFRLFWKDLSRLYGSANVNSQISYSRYPCSIVLTQAIKLY